MSLETLVARRFPGKLRNLLRDPFYRAYFRHRLRQAGARTEPEPGVTVVITSAGRRAYLEQTLTSLRKYLVTGSMPVRLHIVDDFPDDASTREFIGQGAFDSVILNSVNQGLGYSLNRIYLTVRTRYVFHCEDDWEFLRPMEVAGLVEELEASGASQVLLAREDGRSERAVAKNFYSFNPHLTRLETVVQHYPFHLFRAEKRWAERVGRSMRSVLAGSCQEPYVRHLGVVRTGVYT